LKHSIDSINNILLNRTTWFIISFIILLIYLYPLLQPAFYVPVFDNLDSNVVWYKILAESGKIFADNNATIPNMLGGLPRSSYPGEFFIIIWLYYFFEPKTAYVINEILIHLVAFISMYIFLKKYIIPKDNKTFIAPLFLGSLYYATIPFWSGAGLTLAILPLVTYSLLNIKNHQSTLWEWVLLVILPLYTSFVFFYMFYIILAGIYFVWDTYKHKAINRPFFFALLLMGITFLLVEYRLLIAMFIDSEFVSHRIEFDIYFDMNFIDAYRSALNFFLDGHLSHATGLQVFYVIPSIIITCVLSLSKRRFSLIESIVIYLIIFLSFYIDFWKTVLTNIYTLPILLLFSLVFVLFVKNNQLLYRLFLLDILLSFYIGLMDYEGLHFLTDIFPILKELNILRLAFIQPFILAILFTLSLLVFIRKLQLSSLFIIILFLLQYQKNIDNSFYQTSPVKGFASFEQYYAPNLFKKIKNDLDEPVEKLKIISYGIEPAVSQFNGFYTIDGYIPNYPLSYKHQFRKIIEKYLEKETYTSNFGKSLYDKWGSKVYIMSTVSTLERYYKGIVVQHTDFDTRAICSLGASLLISAYEFEKPTQNNLRLLRTYKGQSDSWNIYLYQIKCPKQN